MKNLFLAAALILSSISYAQNDHNGYVAISFGGSSPIGGFESKDMEDEDARFASDGISASIDGAYLLNDNFGLTAKLFSKGWAIDIDDMNSDGIYFSSGILIGGIATIPAGFVNFDFKLQVGYANSKMQDLTFPDTDGDLVMPVAKGRDMAYALGLGLRVHLGKRIDTMMNFDYFNTKPTLKSDLQSLDYDIAATNFTIGIGYRI